jgi:hypothetical protein
VTQDKDWKERKYQQVFDATLRFIRNRRLRDPKFTRETLKKMIETDMIHQGNDWVGRGEYAHLQLTAQIAAYEQILSDWEDG